jgi:hypothetical protein
MWTQSYLTPLHSTDLRFPLPSFPPLEAETKISEPIYRKTRSHAKCSHMNHKNMLEDNITFDLIAESYVRFRHINWLHFCLTSDEFWRDMNLFKII